MRRLLCSFILLAAPLLTVTALPQRLTMGVLEFEEITSIGQENARLAIPEILIGYLKEVGRYTIVERVLLQKALEEQQLQASEAIDAATAVKVGKLYGVSAFVVGSAMKVGELITISARAISAETAEVIASGSVELKRIKDLGQGLNQLAYLLSGYTLAEYRRARFVSDVSTHRFGVFGGGGICMINEVSQFYALFAGGPFYGSRYIEAEFAAATAIPPMTGPAQVAFLVHGYPIDHVGVALGWTWANFSSPTEDQHVLGKEYLTYSSHSLLYGVRYRATDRLRISMYTGFVLSGRLYYQSAGGTEYAYDLKPDYVPFRASPWMSMIEYGFTRDWSARLVMTNVDGWTEDPEPDTPERAKDLKIILQVGYAYRL